MNPITTKLQALVKYMKKDPELNEILIALTLIYLFIRTLVIILPDIVRAIVTTLYKAVRGELSTEFRDGLKER